MTGERVGVPARVAPDRRGELQNLVLFLGDDLRESALAVGGIEAYLVEARRLLEREDLTAEELAAFLDDPGLEDRLRALDDALAGLRKSMSELHSRL